MNLDYFSRPEAHNEPKNVTDEASSVSETFRLKFQRPVFVQSTSTSERDKKLSLSGFMAKKIGHTKPDEVTFEMETPSQRKKERRER